MSKEKKTAPDLASILIAKLMKPEDCVWFDRCLYGQTSKGRDCRFCSIKTRAEQTKLRLKDDADIPDGWDVIKTTYKLLDKQYDEMIKEYDTNTLNHNFKNTEEQRQKWYECQSIFHKKDILYSLLEQAGIEVKDAEL